jgi:hypothetical protein
MPYLVIFKSTLLMIDWNWLNLFSSSFRMLSMTGDLMNNDELLLNIPALRPLFRYPNLKPPFEE